jgi:hypothetical protein
MKAKSIFWVITMSIFLLACKSSVEIPPKIAMEDFFKNPERLYCRISPNGNYISYLAPFGKKDEHFCSKDWYRFNETNHL